MERQQIRIAGYYDIGAAMHGNLQKLVVPWIAADADGRRK